MYLAAIVGINPNLYEVAVMDGANRWKQTIHITLPNTVYEGYPDIQSHKLFQEYLAKIVIGEWSIDTFDELVERWNRSGGDKVTSRLQAWYAQLKK